MSISIFRCGNYCWDVNIPILKNRGWMNIPCNGKSLRILRRVKKYRTNEYNKVLDFIYQQTNELRVGKKENGESRKTFSVSVPRPGIEPGWVAPLVFETSASTDSAIWAFLKCDAKVRIFFVQANFLHIFLKKLFVFLANPTKRSNFASRLLSAHTIGLLVL